MRRGGSYNNAIWCVNVLLALGIFAFAFRYIFFAKAEDTWPENPPIPGNSTGPVDTGMKDYEAIYSSQLVPPAPGPAKPVEQFPQVQYTGMFGSQILFSVGGAEGQGKVQSPIQIPDPSNPGGWKDLEVNGKKVIVKELLVDKVILMIEGTPETKDIPLLNETQSPPAPNAPPGVEPNPQPQPGPGKAPDVGSSTKPSQVAVDPRDRDFVRDHAEELAKDVKWSLYAVENGKAKGVRIEGFTAGSYAEEYAKNHGIKAGDILLSINGKAIDGADTMNHLFGDDQAWDQGKAQVEVERAGKIQVISYAVK